jgi:uncharacterized Zn finger protein (UPF0148 family)
MAGLFGPSAQDLERLRATVQSLGTTSVPGLAAALGWRERKAEKLLAHELQRPGASIVYDPGRRVVRWALPPPASAPAVSPARPTATDSSPALPRAPSPVLTPVGLKTLCPACHVPLMATGSASLAVCPQCGRLASARASAAEPPVSAPRASPPVSSAPAGGVATPLSDRRSQELFAAYVTSGPIACPKCRTPLKHRGIGEYACPACGHVVSFPKQNPVPIPAT